MKHLNELLERIMSTQTVPGVPRQQLKIDMPTPEEVAAMEAEGRRQAGSSAIGWLITGVVLTLVGVVAGAFKTLVLGVGFLLFGLVSMLCEWRDRRDERRLEEIYRIGRS